LIEKYAYATDFLYLSKKFRFCQNYSVDGGNWVSKEPGKRTAVLFELSANRGLLVHLRSREWSDRGIAPRSDIAWHPSHVLLPAWLSVKVLLHAFVLEEESSIAEGACNQWGCQSDVCDQSFFSVAERNRVVRFVARVHLEQDHAIIRGYRARH